MAPGAVPAKQEPDGGALIFYGSLLSRGPRGSRVGSGHKGGDGTRAVVQSHGKPRVLNDKMPNTT